MIRKDWFVRLITYVHAPTLSLKVIVMSIKKDTYSTIPRSTIPKNLFKQALVSLFTACITFASGNILAATSTDFSSQPAVITQTATPLVMLNMSNDHQLFYKAYTDYDDMDSDGILDTTYKDTISYYGYFDPLKCYTYSGATSNGNFAPNTTGFASGANGHHCTGEWSGNFMNWATMSRMDILRKVLYGGKRSTDNVSKTVLERAYLPDDNHAWSKYVSIANIVDLSDYTPYTNASYPAGITLCNVTPREGSTDRSETNTTSPRFRIAKGEWANWSAQERRQCLWDNDYGSADNPNEFNATEYVGEFTVRVEVCDEDLLGSESCKTYNDSGTPRYKPVGLLQTYAESDSIHFGLLTGSYAKGKSGGVLRKNISGITDEIDQSNGTLTGASGIIDTLDRLRISRYAYSVNGYYNGASGDNCKYGQNSWSNGDCSNWGNPLGEMFLETLRYYAGASPNFSATDSSWISGLSEATWKDPYDTIGSGGLGYAACSKPNIINFSTGLLSFDDDEYGGTTDIPGSPNVNTMTDTVGDEENISGNDYYVGSTSGGSPNDTCTSTTVNNLSDVTGLCPEAAGLEGSYKIAGLAYYARNNDISSTIADDQTVNTFSVSLAPPIPELSVDVGGNTVSIIPVAYNWRNKNAMVLVNFQVISQTATTGEFFMNYENAPAGADHDSDFKGYLNYEVVGNNISIVTHNTGSSAGATMHMGYIIDGVSDAGTFHMASNEDVDDTSDTGGGTYSTTKTAVDADCGAIVYPASGNRTICTSGIEGGSGGDRDLRGIRTHTAAASGTDLLENPLWYAAKYGGFKDTDGNNQPNLVSEWDTEVNSTGASGADGIPDNYFLVTNPANLENRLRKVFNDIIERVSSGTAAAVVSNNSSGEGAIYQALYQPLLKNGLDDIIWTGNLQSIFIDDNGFLREDSNDNNQLDDYTTDYRIIYSYDAVNDETLIQKQSSADGGTTFVDVGSTQSLDNLNTVWNAKDQLDTVPQAGITSNRPYANLANTGRYITTWIDSDGDNMVNADGSENVAFEDTVFCNYGGANCAVNNYGYLDVAEAEADNIVNFIRGKESISGYRSRSFDTTGNGTPDDFYLLGDIVHSTPVVVGAPSAAYDIHFDDETYKTFVNTYSDRRQVVYVGANDGMIHAFNAGFWDPANKAFDETSGTRTAHALGTELWAYVPMNLLPHLQWLKELDYPHVYYMDGPPVTFDARIFSDDSIHPGGWGTVLVVGMRLGGGDIAIDTDSNGSDDKTTRSSYVVLDITDPETAPVLIDEITNSNLGFTTSRPTLVKKRAPSADGDWSSPTQDDWYLVFGSGPTTLSDVTSTQQARLYIYDLKVNAFVGGFDGTANITTTTNSTTSFTGDMTAADWSNDYIDDAVYFGTIGGSIATPTGSLQRLRLSNNLIYKLFEPTAGVGAFRSKPSVAVDEDGDSWIYAGSGRLFVTSDALQSTQDAFYGIKEPISSDVFTWGTITIGDLQEVTDVRTFLMAALQTPLAYCLRVQILRVGTLTHSMSSSNTLRTTRAGGSETSR